jgi:serine/threonine-protein kinase
MMAGSFIAGRYELQERLGTGGMSTVRLAFDRRLERHVAIKLLAEHLADDQQFVTRFRREALAAARLVHPNVVQVFDFGFDEASARHYIVMERIVGQSGAEMLRERGRLPVDEAIDIVAQSCRGLEYAHRNGVVHRDVKPGNLLRSNGDGTVKLADFGIAKAASDESSITQVGSVLGTAAYLAPEQAAGEEAGPRADLYALGVVAYQLISGRLPYEAQSLTELALKQQREVPAPLHHLDPTVPPALSAAVGRALALDPRDRHPSADVMRAAVLDGARGIGDDDDATTRAPYGETLATNVMRTQEPSTGATARVPREPREPRVPRAPAASPTGGGVAAPPAARTTRSKYEPAPSRRSGGRVRRTFGLLVLLLLLAAGAAAAYVATSSDGSAVRLRQVVYDRADQVVTELEQLVNDNTK